MIGCFGKFLAFVCMLFCHSSLDAKKELFVNHSHKLLIFKWNILITFQDKLGIAHNDCVLWPIIFIKWIYPTPKTPLCPQTSICPTPTIPFVLKNRTHWNGWCGTNWFLGDNGIFGLGQNDRLGHKVIVDVYYIFCYIISHILLQDGFVLC